MASRVPRVNPAKPEGPEVKLGAALVVDLHPPPVEGVESVSSVPVTYSMAPAPPPLEAGGPGVGAELLRVPRRVWRQAPVPLTKGVGRIK
jgi:hypothetical protein